MKLLKGVPAASIVFGTTALYAADEHAAHGGHNAWGYTGHTGPEHWGDISEKFRMCGIGKNQTPINIASSIEADLPEIGLSYSAKAAEIWNNGHTIQINVENGSSVTIEGKTFQLKQFHFHIPSENHIEGKSFAMEAHFVHLNEQGDIAVIGVMFNLGKENPAIAKLWSKMPFEHDEKKSIEFSSDEMKSLIPSTKEYYRFNGSLTTPPCSEGVTWLVISAPLELSQEQIDLFTKAMGGHANNRPIQPTNARPVLQ